MLYLDDRLVKVARVTPSGLRKRSAIKIYEIYAETNWKGKSTVSSRRLPPENSKLLK